MIGVVAMQHREEPTVLGALVTLAINGVLVVAGWCARLFRGLARGLGSGEEDE